MPKRRNRRLVKPPANRHTEEAVYYYPYVGEFMQKHFGRKPSRTTLGKYLKAGYPIKKGGPYVVMPTFDALHRPMATRQAMERFLTLVRLLERKLKVNSG